MLVGVLLRLSLAWVFGSVVTDFPSAYDHRSYEMVASIMERGGNVYAETHRYNYTPLWSFILLGCSWFAEWVGAPLAFVVRVLLTLVDLANACLIAHLAVEGYGPWRRRWSVAFAVAFLNPASVVLTGAHGQFENLAALPLLASIWLICRFPHAHTATAWALGAAALVAKHIWIFGVWTMFVYFTRDARRSAMLLAASLAATALTFIPYVREGANGILVNVLLYRSNPEPYGLRALIPGSLGGPVAVALFLTASRGRSRASRTLTQRARLVAQPAQVSCSYR